MKFICDHMLGTLARWLRLLGFDVLYPGPLSDKEIKEIAGKEGRTVLTRDKELGSTDKVPALYIESDDLEEQLEFTVSRLRLTVDNPMSRCSLCNSPIKKIVKAKVGRKVPSGVLERQNEFWFCPRCDKYYWQGSHWDQIVKRIKKLESS